MENNNPTVPPPPPQPQQGNPYQQQGNPYQQQANPYQQAPGGYQQFGGGFAGQMDHPRASTVNSLGITGLILTFIIGIVGLILNIIALSMASGAMNDIKANPGKYTDASIRKLKAGRTCAIVGLSIQGAAILILILVIAANA